MTLADTVDLKDQFIKGHNVRARARQSEKDIPALLQSNAGIQKVISRVYPRWKTDQRVQAGRCARIIYLYYRSNMTGRQCADELGLTYRVFINKVAQIKRAANGERMDGKGIYRRKRRKK
jgi:hypothetical protein